jgi:hypothetical protein
MRNILGTETNGTVGTTVTTVAGVAFLAAFSADLEHQQPVVINE